MNAFQSLHDYEEYVYTLKQRYPYILRSRLVVVPQGRRTAVLQGEISFAYGYRLTIWEQLSADTGVVVISDYGYELWHNADKIAWYDSELHPNDPTLAGTYPHHKHVPPDIKRHRVPCAGNEFYTAKSSAVNSGN